MVSGPPCRWIEGDALSLPFDSNAFDAATMGYGLRNVTDIPRSLREILRVLKPGKGLTFLCNESHKIHRVLKPGKGFDFPLAVIFINCCHLAVQAVAVIVEVRSQRKM